MASKVTFVGFRGVIAPIPTLDPPLINGETLHHCSPGDSPGSNKRKNIHFIFAVSALVLPFLLVLHAATATHV